MFDYEKKVVGTPKYNVPITAVSVGCNSKGDITGFININNGCMMARCGNKWYYDGAFGQEMKSDTLYVWNSQVKGKNGQIKKTFSVSRDDLTRVLIDQLAQSTLDLMKELD